MYAYRLWTMFFLNHVRYLIVHTVAIFQDGSHRIDLDNLPIESFVLIMRK